MRAAKYCGGQCALDSVNRIVIQFEIFFRSPLPVTDVRLIPQLPIPFFHFYFSIPVNTMECPLVNKFRPFVVVFWRVGPATVDVGIWSAWFPGMLVGFRLDRQSFRHKAYFKQGSHASVYV